MATLEADTILVDERVGSRELLASLRGLGVDATLAGKLSADFEFVGFGDPEVNPHPLIGIERKTITDLVQSMRDRRLAGSQHVGMTQAYDECYLIVEGIWRRQRDTGLLEYRNGGWHVVRGQVRYAEVDRFLCSLEVLSRDYCDFHIWRTQDEEETCAAIADRYLWWQKEWHEHSTMRAIYAPEPGQKHGRKPRLFRRGATLLEKWLHDLPGIGERALDLAPYFSSPRDMANAEVDRWMTIEGQRMGRKTAQNIVAAVRGEET